MERRSWPPPGKDAVLIVDLADTESPTIVACLPLKNSVVGPPVNLDIDPTGNGRAGLELVDIVKDGDALKQVPDNKILCHRSQGDPAETGGDPDRRQATVGMNFSPSGKMALVANRGDNSISVLSIDGTDVKITDTVAMPDSVSHVVFTPDGNRALTTRFPANTLRTRYRRRQGDLQQGRSADRTWPYNVVVSPDSKIALTSDNGGAGSSDGSVDTTSVIDLEAEPPRSSTGWWSATARRGLRSPKGDLAVATILRGSNNKKAFFYNKNGSLSILKIDGKKVTKTQDIEVGGLPEAVAFTPDGKYILAGNFLTEDFSILKVDGTKVTDTGKRFKVPGHPASARMGP